VHGLSYIDERLMMFSEALGLPYYFAIDKDYSVRALVDKTGALIERYCYDPYGNPLIRESTGRGDLFNSSLPGDDNGLRFAAAKDACTSGCIWDPRADIDADGDVDGDDQDAYDALASTWGAYPTVAQAFSGVGNPFAFQGRPHFALDTAGDAQTATVQLLDHRNRFMDPILGRWLTRDPIGYDGGTSNLFESMGSNPARWLDPSGLSPNQYQAFDPYDLLREIRGWEAQGLTRGEIIAKIEARYRMFNTTHPRYFFADGIWIDAEHFFRSAFWTGRLGPVPTWVGGIAVEIGQSFMELFKYLTKRKYYKSAWSEEDVPSDDLGINFGLLLYGPEYDRLAFSEAFAEWLRRHKALPPTDPGSGFGKLPRTDPSDPGGSGSRGSSGSGGGGSNPPQPYDPENCGGARKGRG
jgi:RHS repeat-associated protein